MLVSEAFPARGPFTLGHAYGTQTTLRSNARIHAMPEVPAALIEQFINIVGEPNAISDPADMAPYLTEWRDRYHGRAALVLKPGSTEEVAAILRLANETRTPIVPQGGNTGLVGGQVPHETGNEIVISLSRLNRVRAIDPAGYTMTVEAGVILEQAQNEADAHDRLFPLSLAAEGSCQVGGNISTNAGGTAVLAYGNTRELVLGLEVVMADGRIWNGLRALRKDNTGYDLKDLFIGAEGTLGIVTAAVLKLFPKPAERATAMAGLADLKRVARFFATARDAAHTHLTTFEVICRRGIEFVVDHGDNVREPLQSHPEWYVLMELSGQHDTGEMTALAETILERAFSEELVEDAIIAQSLAQAHDLWRLRELLPELQGPEGGSIKHDISVPVARIPEFIERANARVTSMIDGARPVPFGHFGDGNIHYNISQPRDMDKAAFLAHWDEVIAAVHAIVLELGGSISAEHGIGRMKREMLAEMKDPLEMELMHHIKSGFDPNGILNPGKVL